MKKVMAFGVGCFHFGLKKIKPPSMSGEDYIQELIHAIESIPNVKKVDVDVPDEFKEEIIEASESLAPIEEGNVFFRTHHVFSTLILKYISPLGFKVSCLLVFPYQVFQLKDL
jgi:hypothetical protein